MRVLILLLLFALVGMCTISRAHPTPLVPEHLTEQDSALTVYECEAKSGGKVTVMRDIGGRRAYATVQAAGITGDCFTQFGKIQGLTMHGR